MWSNAGKTLSDAATRTREAWDSARKRFESPGWQFFPNEPKWGLPQKSDWNLFPQASDWNLLPDMSQFSLLPKFGEDKKNDPMEMPTPRLGRNPQNGTSKRF